MSISSKSNSSNSGSFRGSFGHAYVLVASGAPSTTTAAAHEHNNNNNNNIKNSSSSSVLSAFALHHSKVVRLKAVPCPTGAKWAVLCLAVIVAMVIAKKVLTISLSGDDSVASQNELSSSLSSSPKKAPDLSLVPPRSKIDEIPKSLLRIRNRGALLADYKFKPGWCCHQSCFDCFSLERILLTQPTFHPQKQIQFGTSWLSGRTGSIFCSINWVQPTRLHAR